MYVALSHCFGHRLYHSFYYRYGTVQAVIATWRATAQCRPENRNSEWFTIETATCIGE